MRDRLQSIHSQNMVWLCVYVNVTQKGRIGSRSRSTSQEHDHKSRQIVGNPLDVDSIGSDLGNIEEHSGFEDGAGMIEPKSTSEAEVRVL